MRRTVTAMRAAVVLFLAAVSVSAQSTPPELPAPRATVAQLMRGILFVNSNVVFFAESEDPAAVTRDLRSERAVNSLAGSFGGWPAVENAALALVESTTLLELPRPCSNGQPAPVKDAEWQKALANLRQAATAAYNAARAKNLDFDLGIGEQLTSACTSCHRMFHGGSPDPRRRCTK